jgi:LysM repeat protein
MGRAIGRRRRALLGGARGKYARWVAPAVFLLAVTGVVLLVRTALRSDSKAEPATRRSVAVQHGSPPAATVGRARVRIPAQWYVIRSGDTLDAIAVHFGTTVDKLLALNAGVEPTTLRPGERVRIK